MITFLHAMSESTKNAYLQEETHNFIFSLSKNTLPTIPWASS